MRNDLDSKSLVRGSARRLPLLCSFGYQAALLALVGCGALGAEGCQLPPSRTVADRAGLHRSCRSDAPVSMFVAGLAATTRAEIETALSKSVAVVHYDCETFELLPACTLEGDYHYTGLAPRTDAFRISDDAELDTNLGVGAQGVATQLGEDRWDGKALDVSLAIRGRKTALRASATRAELRGECDGATHFVHSALLGAFTLQQVLRDPPRARPGRPRATTLSRQDGSLQSCRASSAPDGEPSPGCSSPLRLELLPLSTVAAPAVRPAAKGSEEATLLFTCPTGTRATDAGKCVGPRSHEPSLCSFEDVADCERQCSRGSMASCAILARSYETGRGVQVDVQKARSLYVRACERDVGPACGRLGAILLRDGNSDEGRKLLLRSCATGWAEGCEIAAAEAKKAGKAISVDLLKRSCESGRAESCFGVGGLFQEGLLVPKNQAEATRYFKLACEGGARLGCSSYAVALEEGVGTPRDPAGALAILRSSCDRGYSSSCSALSTYYFLGKHVPQDNALGIRLLEHACEGTDTGSCVVIGMRYANGVGTHRDAAMAKRYFTRACEAGIIPACVMLKAREK